MTDYIDNIEAIIALKESDWIPAVQDTNLGENSWQTLVYDGTKFVALGIAGYISTSIDGTTWTTAIQNTDLGSNRWITLAYGDNKFVALGERGYVSTSTDGETWTPAEYNADLGSNSWYGLIYDGTKFVALGYYGYISTSTDGTTWTPAVEDTNLGSNKWYDLVYDGIKFVALGVNGYISTSTDGITWTTAVRNTDLGNNNWRTLVYDGTKFIALGRDGYTSTSTDGTTWTTAMQNSNLGSNDWRTLVYDGAKFVALGRGGYISKTASSYAKSLQIDGDNFDGGWVESALTGLNEVTIAKSGTSKISLASYLPNDGYDYEVVFMARARTGTSSGNTADLYIHSGSSTSDDQIHVGYVRTRTASYEDVIHTCSIVVKGNDRNLLARNGNSSASLVAWLYLKAYRRLGRNSDVNTNNVSNIQSSSATVSIGGNNFAGQWVPAVRELHASGSIAANASLTYSLEDYLPNDGADYIVALSGYGQTGSTSGNNVWIKVNTSTDYYVYGCRTRSGSTRICGGTALIPIVGGSRSITITNGTTAGTAQYSLKGYRRVGKGSLNGTQVLCIPSATPVPNGVVQGSPLVTDGVMSDFSENNYLDVNGKRYNTSSEYIVKFTTGDSTVSHTQSIMTAENLFTIEITKDSWVVNTYDWFTSTNVTLFTAEANTTYWVKMTIDGYQKVIYYSIDGVNFTQVASFSDPEADPTDFYPLRFGAHSRNSLSSSTAFSGSIDLNECSVSVSGEQIWSGMGYGKYCQIGGPNFDGRWISKTSQLLSVSTIEAKGTIEIDVSEYLPSDNYQYEVLLYGNIWTKTSSGNSAELIIGSDIIEDEWYLCRRNTRAAYGNADASSLIVPVGIGRKIIARNGISAVASGSASLTAVAYRRVGINV